MIPEAHKPMTDISFDYIAYPLWRRHMPAWLKPLADAVLSQVYPVQEDRHPPSDPMMMAQSLSKWGLLNEPLQAIAAALADVPAQALEVVDRQAQAQPHDGSPVHLPAQWEATERVLVAWPIVYPPVWLMHAQMVEAISAVALCDVCVPSELWGRAVYLYLARRGRARLDNLRLLALPTNDVWIRDYGPIVGRSASGERVALNATYAVLPQYPQGDDDAMPAHYAAHRGLKLQTLPLYTEGGNLWTDGRGTLIMSEQIFYSNPYHDRDSLLRVLHQHIAFDKLILTPRLTLEETGHVDLLLKLAAPDVALVSAPTWTSSEALRKARRALERATNAQGQPYTLLELPTPPLKLNWFAYTLRRHYTNALTVNGRVLVPVYRLPTDEPALRVYEQAMPDYEIIPIDSAIGANGGGAVHCMTKEIPR
jgi:agmatine deiminase